METYTPKEIAEMLGKSTTTIREYLRIGKPEEFKKRGRSNHERKQR